MVLYSLDYLMAEIERKQAELARAKIAEKVVVVSTVMIEDVGKPKATMDPTLNLAFGLNELIELLYNECEQLETICEELRMSSSRSPGDPGYPGQEADILERCQKINATRHKLVGQYFADKSERIAETLEEVKRSQEPEQQKLHDCTDLGLM